MNESLLEKIGLTKSEIKVYLALLELGCSATGKIVEKSKASSSKIYEILDKLMQKGLASFIVKSGVKYFEAAPPNRIMEYMKEKENEIVKQREELKSVIPELELKQQLSKYKSEATIFKGMKGAETAFRQMLGRMKKTDEWVAFVVDFKDKRYYDLLTRLHKFRSERGIKSRLIINEKLIEIGREREKLPNTQIKYVPSTINTPAVINVAGDISILNIMSEDITAFMIDSKEIADAFREQFERLWDQRVTIYEGTDEIKELLKKTLKFGDYVTFAEGMKIVNVLGEDFFIWWQNEKKKEGIKSKGIMGAKYENMITAKKSVTDFKFISNYEAPGTTMVFDDKVVNLILTGKPMAFLIENKEVAMNNKSYFDLLWNQKVQTYEGQDSVETAIQYLYDNCTAEDEVIVFAAKPSNERAARFNLEWNRSIRKKVKRSRLLFYGDTELNRMRAKEVAQVGCETKVMHTAEALPISTIVVGNMILDVVWGKEPIAFRFENKTIADSFRANFEMLWNQDTRVLKGIDAIKEIFEEMLEYGSCDYIAARGYFVERAPEEYITDWEKRAKEKGFVMRNIVDPGVKGHRITKFPFAQTKYTLPKEFANLSVFWIYGNKVAISNWADKEPIIIVIENKNMYDMYKQQFELLWNQDVFAQKGLENVHHAWNNMLDELNPGEEYYVLSASWYGQSKHVSDFFVDFHKKRINKGINVKFIFSSEMKSIISKHKEVYDVKSEIRYQDFMMYEGMQINLYRNKVLIFIWREKEPIIITIEDKNVFNGFKSYFDAMWKISK